MTTQEIFKEDEQNFQNLVNQLKEIEKTSFSGNLIIQVPSTQSWMISFSSGYLSQVHGGIDPEHRWQRNLEIAHLNLPLDSSINEDDLNTAKDTNTIAQQSAVLEVLFDIIQYVQFNNNQLSYQLIPVGSYALRANTSLPLLKTRTILAQVLFNWQEWSNAGLGNYFPGKFVNTSLTEPILMSIEDRGLRTLLLSIDGSQSLRNLAIRHHKHILEFTQPLLSLIQKNIIFFSDLVIYNSTEIENTSGQERLDESPAALTTESKIAGIATDRLPINSQPLIACIDDELSVYESLEQILTQHGYRSFGVQDPRRIITALIQNKPDLIFLDLIMPAINGYEICEKIRKISSLKNVPIVILSSRDGSFERERAELSGANGFLGKPIRSTSVLEVLNRYVQMSNS
ncbi:response regulator [Chamaesiphon sp. OTE_75_metabat_556]|uniref:response regulator n=1 Tax=Chamaesiphon sp. OTE_75_metabat_556 TaxID=2964692 RepID=UPI00286AE085|nr:response regulator [Chamaesiphon sp. OTE_75_metabat_556]